MGAWDIFLIVAAGVGTISAFAAALVAIVQYIKTGTNFVRRFLSTHGLRGEVHRLEQSVSSLAGSIENMQGVIEKNTAKLNNINDELDANTRLTLKLELKSLFRNHPTEILVIKKTWKKYHDLGGDSYIDDMYETWQEQYEKPYLQKTLKKGAK